MPFNDPHFSLSDSVNAGQQIVSPLQKALQKYEEDKRKADFNQGAFDMLATQSGPNGESYIKPEILEKWHRMNPDAQAGTLAGIGGQIQNDMKKAELDRQNKLADAQTAEQHALANKHEADAYKVWTGQDGTGDTPSVIDQVIDPVTKQPIPGRGIVRKTGSVIDTNAETPTDVQFDPTGKFYLDHKTRSWKPIPSGSLVLPGLNQTAPGVQPSPPGAPPTPVGPPASPAVSPTPAATPAPTLTARDHEAVQWAIANPQDPRAAAILKKLGIQ